MIDKIFVYGLCLLYLLAIICGIALLVKSTIKNIKKLIKYFKRPKCPNNHRCGDCHNCIWNFQETDDFKAYWNPSFICKINAR